jgi:hypothetical protein
LAVYSLRSSREARESLMDTTFSSEEALSAGTLDENRLIVSQHASCAARVLLVVAALAGSPGSKPTLPD